MSTADHPQRFVGAARGYLDHMGIVFGLIALAVILVVVGLAFTAVKWLLIVAAVLFLLGVLRAAMSSRNASGSGTH